MDPIPALEHSERRGLERVGDEGHAKARVVRFHNRQTDPIDRHGTFPRHVAHQLRWPRKFEESPLSFIAPMGDHAHRIDMASDKVPPKPVSRFQGAFTIHPPTDLEFSETGSRQGFGSDFKGATISIDGDDGETAPRKADAVADLCPSRQRPQIEREPMTEADDLAPNQRHGSFYESCKHLGIPLERIVFPLPSSQL